MYEQTRRPRGKKGDQKDKRSGGVAQQIEVQEERLLAGEGDKEELKQLCSSLGLRPPKGFSAAQTGAFLVGIVKAGSDQLTTAAQILQSSNPSLTSPSNDFESLLGK